MDSKAKAKAKAKRSCSHVNAACNHGGRPPGSEVCAVG
jgi:hypothetical protein